MPCRSRRGLGIGTVMREVTNQCWRTAASSDQATGILIGFTAQFTMRISRRCDTVTRRLCEISRHCHWHVNRPPGAFAELLTLGGSRPTRTLVLQLVPTQSARAGCRADCLFHVRSVIRSTSDSHFSPTIQAQGTPNADSGIPLPVRSGVNERRWAVAPYRCDRRTRPCDERTQVDARTTTTRREATE